ncbi:cytochrome-c peroxidase [Chitinophagaceae bacterium MMS25-I14]
MHFKRKKAIIICLLVIFVAGASAFKNVEENELFKTPDGWPKPVYDFKKNPLNPAAIALGKQLFFETALSRDATISCASCHLPQTAFTHIDHNLSHGIEGRIGTRNSPALMNLAWSKDFMWDGSVHHLEEQPVQPITNPLEMDEKMERAIAKLQQKQQYRELFKEAFGDTAVTGANMMKALTQFMLTAVSASSKYDKVIQGKATFNEYESRGYTLFRANCASCHKEPLFTNNSFENNGLGEDTALNDAGRMKVTHNEADRGKFKVPTLRNVEVTYPYMHDGRFRNLQMVLFHYTNEIKQNATLSSKLRKPIVLTEENKRDLIAFLKTLTDEQFLHDPRYQQTINNP